MQNIYKSNLEWDDSFKLSEEEEKLEADENLLYYLFAFILFNLFLLSFKNHERALDHAWTKFKNKHNKSSKNSSKPSLKSNEEIIIQKQQALAKTELKTAKHWAEKKDDIVIDEEYLKQLDELIASQEEWLHTSAEGANEVQDVATSETDSKEEIKQGIKPRRAATFAKKERPTDSPIKAIPTKDKVLMWHTNLPSYNLSKHVSTDPNRIVYPLGSGNRFIFINKYLRLFLESNHAEAFLRLLHLCEMGRDQLPNNSKGHSGFIFKEEGNAKTLDKTMVNKIASDKEDKSEKNKKSTYVKVKDCVKNYRFFGEDVATTNGKKQLFEINGFRPRHKNQDKITYFPSEAAKLK